MKDDELDEVMIRLSALNDAHWVVTQALFATLCETNEPLARQLIELLRARAASPMPAVSARALERMVRSLEQVLSPR